MRERAHPLLDPTILIVALCYGPAIELASRMGIFGVPFWLFLTLSLWRYCYTLLREFAHGHARPPPPDIESMNPVGEMGPLLHAAFFVLGTTLCLTTPLLGEGAMALLARGVAALALIGAFPASAALMGVTGSLTAAFTPSSILGIIETLRGDYLLLVLRLAMLVGAAALVGALLDTGFFGALLLAVIGTWVQLAAYATIGRAINARGQDLDLPGEFERRMIRDELERDRDWQKTLDRAYGSIRSGLVAEGYRTIRQLAETEGESVEIYQWTFNRMLEWQDRAHALAVAPRFVERLVAAGRLHDALDLADQCRRLAQGPFELAPPLTAQLVAYARSAGRHRSADELSGLLEPVFDPRARHSVMRREPSD